MTSYLNEGLTDFLAVQALGLSEQAEKKTYGYPLHIQAVELLAQQIPLLELEQIYFTQDEPLFKKTFNQYLSGSNYQEFMNILKKINDYHLKGNDQTFIPELKQILDLR